ncbi:MAG TPA: Fic family protein [Candidatus Onthousia faecipullorum]|mgnify:FL=1|uniref:Fic family protein n=1 Tax=Candidatus Onthousia faecipullorum TaxID=2840887 RepID=A0A9D1GAR3_9FIRM|nr:Fic family protein [Candidatus Onthousia faecipullorum]
MENKYNMTKEDNIFFAKRKLVDNIYKSANLEGIAVTFADTYAFMNNVNTGNISIDDMLKLKGLKDAWQYVFDTIDEEITIDYIKKIHFEICKGQNVSPLGDFRDKGVGITGTSWHPKLPSECNYEDELKNILSINKELERSITLFCWIQRSQMFLDGNKRVANLVANKEMIKNGQGIISIPIEKIGEYFTKLINYYETNDMEELKLWIYNNCIDGINLN